VLAKALLRGCFCKHRSVFNATSCFVQSTSVVDGDVEKVTYRRETAAWTAGTLRERKTVMRSLWKGPFVDHFLLRLLDEQTDKDNSPLLLKNRKKIWSRRSVVLPQFVGIHFAVHNGIRFVSLTVIEDIVGHKFGEFAITRKRPVHKRKSKKKT
jgi:small subunit ribosomal protein S19